MDCDARSVVLHTKISNCFVPILDFSGISLPNTGGLSMAISRRILLPRLQSCCSPIVRIVGIGWLNMNRISLRYRPTALDEYDMFFETMYEICEKSCVGLPQNGQNRFITVLIKVARCLEAVGFHQHCPVSREEK